MYIPSIFYLVILRS